MTTETTPTDFATAVARVEAEMQEQKRRIAEARPANKAALFDALAAAGITSVEVNFDGSGDSGQIVEVTAWASEAKASLPAQSIELVEPGKDGEPINRTTLTVADAIEILVYDVLDETQSGWPNDDGAYGDFTFDVVKRTIALDYNERHIESDYSHHEF